MPINTPSFALASVVAPAVALVVLGSAGSAHAGLLVESTTLDLSGMSSNNFQGDAINDTLTIDGLLGQMILSVDYDVNMTGVGLSWFEDATYSLWDGEVGGTLVADGSSGDLSYAPGAQDSLFENSTASGSHDIDDYVMTTDSLVIELHEWNFDDNAGPDALYNDGSELTVFHVIPAPAAAVLLGIAGLAGRRRRRG